MAEPPPRDRPRQATAVADPPAAGSLPAGDAHPPTTPPGQPSLVAGRARSRHLRRPVYCLLLSDGRTTRVLLQARALADLAVTASGAWRVRLGERGWEQAGPAGSWHAVRTETVGVATYFELDPAWQWRPDPALPVQRSGPSAVGSVRSEGTATPIHPPSNS